MMSNAIVRNGLRGVVAAETVLSEVNGEAGQLVIRGFPLEEIAPNAEFEEMIVLLTTGEFPTGEERESIKRQLATHRELPEGTFHLLRDAAVARMPAMDTLRMAVGTLRVSSEEGDPLRTALPLIAKFPIIVATYYRLVHGEELLQSRSDLGHVANYLYLMRGEVPGKGEVRALETYLNTVVDHGLNASTFTARVITSTGSDLVSAITGAVGALKGPLHGGAPGPALDMVFEIGELDRAEEYLRAKLERGERLMGFGHRIYKVRDPRADVLAEATKLLFAEEGDISLYNLATGVEKIALALLEEYKPGRNLQTNVEFYTALLLYGTGLPTDFFTPTFAVSRMVGWIAHSFEQEELGTIIRPESVYNGPRDRKWER